MAADLPAELREPIPVRALDAAIAAFNAGRPKKRQIQKRRAMAMRRAVRAAIREWFFGSEAYRAGAMLSNCAFNLSQASALGDAARRSLKESQVAWDRATQSRRFR